MPSNSSSATTTWRKRQHYLCSTTLVSALAYAAWLHQLRREAPITQANAEAAIAAAREYSLPQYETMGTFFRGWALAQQGQGEAGLAALRQGRDANLATGVKLIQPYFFAMLAETAQDEPEMGLAALAEARSIVDTTEEHWWESELYRLQGELWMRADSSGQKAGLAPEACFREALDIARRQEAKSLELRAATSLARLWQSQDKRQDAYDLLAPVYGWFTEGFDTADLKDARALLDELAGDA